MNPARTHARLPADETPLRVKVHAINANDRACRLPACLSVGTTGGPSPGHDSLPAIARSACVLQDGASLEAKQDKVQRIMAPLILRRLKSEVLGQLTPKTEKMEELPMLPAQRQIYEKVIAEYKARKAAGGASLKKKDFEHIFTELRKIANHPLLSR
jgi:hypothetical protein